MIDAADGGNLLIVKKLFKKRGDDIDINAVNSQGETALFQSSCTGHIGITTFLLETEGIDINKPETLHGITPLFVASKKNHIEIVKLLLGAGGIEINQPRYSGGTALAMAKQEKHKEIVQLLATAGATE